MLNSYVPIFSALKNTWKRLYFSRCPMSIVFAVFGNKVKNKTKSCWIIFFSPDKKKTHNLFQATFSSMSTSTCDLYNISELTPYCCDLTASSVFSNWTSLFLNVYLKLWLVLKDRSCPLLQIPSGLSKII